MRNSNGSSSNARHIALDLSACNHAMELAKSVATFVKEAYTNSEWSLQTHCT